ncbi:MAG: VWA domain-containing protein [Lentisphaeria bacterium]|nr:VWA domain-containing protein [Lentisphaeria bacterium]
MRFAWPWFLAALIVPAAILFVRRRRPGPAARVARLPPLPTYPRLLSRSSVPLFLETAALVLFVVAMARPQRLERDVGEERRVVDITVVLDLSGSMDAVDLPEDVPPVAAARLPSRLAIAKATLRRFVESRPGDRFALIVFGRRPYPACPLTVDHAPLLARMEKLDTEWVEDGTGLTPALALAGSGRAGTEPAPRVIVLLTDGRDNVPAERTPEQTAALLRELGCTVHVVGIGSSRAVLPVRGVAGMEYRNVDTPLDEERLRAVAAAGGGVYLAAGDPDAFAAAMTEIDRMVKTSVVEKVDERRSELYPGIVFAGLLLLGAAAVLARTLCLSLP